MDPAWHATQLRCVFASDLVIVMDKPPLESGPWEGNTESYSRSLHHLQPRKIFVGKNFVKFLLLRKLRNFLTTKIWRYTVHITNTSSNSPIISCETVSPATANATPKGSPRPGKCGVDTISTECSQEQVDVLPSKNQVLCQINYCK